MNEKQMAWIKSELSRGQMAVFIEHLQQFIERSDAEKRRAEVEGLLKEIL